MNGYIHVYMVSFEPAEIADLIGIHILDTLGKIIDVKQVGLYWDHGLISIPDSNGLKSSKIQEKMISY